MGKLLILIPAYNEAENIERVVENLKENHSEYDYVVVNDGSKDKTYDICKKILAEKSSEFKELSTVLGYSLTIS